MTYTKFFRKAGAWMTAAALVFALGSAQAATITIVNNNAAGVGFNDPTPRAPVGGNPGVTLGAQRLFIFQHAASIWGSILPSNVTILVRAQFAAQTCNATSAVLGSAGPITIHRDFANAPFTGTWYHQSLANRLAEVDLSPANPDITATFNLNIDSGCFSGTLWYYGIDGLEGTNIELLPVVLHELGHGLGFSTTTSGTTGNFNGGFPHVYDHFLVDNTNGLHWDVMTPAQRIASAIAIDHLAWDGPAAMAAAATFLGPRPECVVNSPGAIAGSKVAQLASFGPQSFSLTGDVVLVNDGTPDNADACEPIINGAALVGKIALINRGTCTFVAKCAAAQAAGAIGVLIANNVTPGPAPMGGSDPSITIPCMGLTLADGTAIQAELLNGPVNVTMGFNALLKAGADNAGRPLVYTPAPFQGGSSVSHWDTSMLPNALMEPAINGNLHDTVDLTLGHFTDIGWFQGTVPVTLQDFVAEGREDGIVLRWRFSDDSDVGAITVERAGAVEGPWAPAALDVTHEGSKMTALDATAEPGVTQYYRLRVMDRSGEVSVLGMASAKRVIESSLRVSLGAPVPNPASLSTSVSYRVATAQNVKLTVHDVSGRQVRVLLDGRVAAGDHVQQWDGRTDGGAEASAGVYFIRMHTANGVKTQRITIVR